MVEKDYNAKGIGLFLQGYCNLYQIGWCDKGKITELADLLITLRTEGYHGSCWGYNFDWQRLNSFLFPKHTPTVVATCFCASALLEAGVDRDGIVESAFNCYRTNRIRLLGHMLDQRLHVTPEGAAWMILTKEIKERFDYRDGETEGFVNVPLTAKDIRLSIFLSEEDDRFRVSIRSKKGTSARDLAGRFFNGGGHENASGGRLLVPDDIPEKGDVEAYVENALKEYLK